MFPPIKAFLGEGKGERDYSRVSPSDPMFFPWFSLHPKLLAWFFFVGKNIVLLTRWQSINTEVDRNIKYPQNVIGCCAAVLHVAPDMSLRAIVRKESTLVNSHDLPSLAIFNGKLKSKSVEPVLTNLCR